TLYRLRKRAPFRHGSVVCLPQLIIDTVERPRRLIKDRCLHCAWVTNECYPQPRRFGPVAVAFDLKLNAIGNSGRAYSQRRDSQPGRISSHGFALLAGEVLNNAWKYAVR